MGTRTSSEVQQEWWVRLAGQPLEVPGSGGQALADMRCSGKYIWLLGVFGGIPGETGADAHDGRERTEWPWEGISVFPESGPEAGSTGTSLLVARSPWTP